MTFFIETQTWVLEHLLSIEIFAGVLVLFYLLRAVVVSRLKAVSQHTQNRFDDVAVDLLRSFGWVFAVVLAFVLAAPSANVNISEMAWLQIVIILVVTYQVARVVGVLIRGSFGAVTALRQVVKLVVWLVGILVILDTFGVDITSLVAGLGIGGIAVALAVQNVLGDVFSSFSIYFDKPFTVGDYIQVGEQDGTVEKIGLKTTRLRSLRGEEVVVSNRDLTTSVVQNFGKLTRRRVVVSLGFEYDTPNKKLECVHEAMEGLVHSIEKLTFDRFHFRSFGDSALLFDLVYYVESKDYDDHIASQHTLNMILKEYLEKQKINMAFPTQTIHVKK